jgi:hypothetical protein
VRRVLHYCCAEYLLASVATLRPSAHAVDTELASKEAA